MVHILMRKIVNEWIIVSVFEDSTMAHEMEAFLESNGIEAQVVPHILVARR